MRFIYSLALMLLLSCSEFISLEKKTYADNNQPYVISIVSFMEANNFIYQLCDSLDQHIELQNKTGLGKIIEDDKSKNVFYGWLQTQFDDAYSGIGLKAPSKLTRDRTSDELKVKNKSNSTEKFSFTADYRVDSIPKEFLYPELWKKAVSNNKYEKKIQSELESYRNGGILIRTREGINDTLYGYEYRIPIDITLNYYSRKNKNWINSNFTLTTKTVVYHQLKYKINKFAKI